MADYIYSGDRHTSQELKGAECSAIRRDNGKCIRAASKMLVEFDGVKHVILARRLKKNKLKY